MIINSRLDSVEYLVKKLGIDFELIKYTDKPSIKLNKVYLLLFLILLSGCTSLPMATSEDTVVAKQFNPDPSEGMVYIYRPWQFAGGVRDSMFRFDGAEYVIENGSFYCFHVTPGKYDAWGFALNGAATLVELEVAKGSMHFLSLNPVAFDFRVPRIRKEYKVTGKEAVSNMKMIKQENKDPKY